MPQFGSFTTTSFGSGNDVSPNTLVGGAATAFDSHFYAQTRKEKTLSAQLVSNWTPDLSSETQVVARQAGPVHPDRRHRA